jgi:hypothetical protein
VVVHEGFEDPRSLLFDLLNFAPCPAGRLPKPLNKDVKLRKRQPDWLTFGQAGADRKGDFVGKHSRRGQIEGATSEAANRVPGPIATLDTRPGGTSPAKRVRPLPRYAGIGRHDFKRTAASGGRDKLVTEGCLNPVKDDL